MPHIHSVILNEHILTIKYKKQALPHNATAQVLLFFSQLLKDQEPWNLPWLKTGKQFQDYNLFNGQDRKAHNTQWRNITEQRPNLKTFSTKIALQHPDNRCTFSVAYCIKYFINLTSMIYLHLNRELRLNNTSNQINKKFTSRQQNQQGQYIKSSENFDLVYLPRWDVTLQVRPT